MIEILKMFSDPFVKIAPKLPETAIIVLLGYLVSKIIDLVVWYLLRIIRFPQGFKPLLISIIKMGWWVIVLIFIANSLGLGKFAVALSGSALILAFFLNNGAANLIADIVAGFYLIKDKDFGVGKRVILNDGKVEGVIKAIDMRKVRIVDDQEKVHVIPNSLVEKSPWTNLGREKK